MSAAVIVAVNGALLINLVVMFDSFYWIDELLMNLPSLTVSVKSASRTRRNWRYKFRFTKVKRLC
jgi:hypothetical protein